MNNTYNIEIELKTCKFFLFIIATILILILLISTTIGVEINKNLHYLKKEIVNACEYIKDNNIP